MSSEHVGSDTLREYREEVTRPLVRLFQTYGHGNRKWFVIAHRLSTVRDADTILVLEGGEIVERGSHEELIAADGLYANLWRVQAGELGDLPEEFVERASERVAQQAIGERENDR